MKVNSALHMGPGGIWCVMWNMCYFLKGSICLIARVVFFPAPDPAKCLKFNDT